MKNHLLLVFCWITYFLFPSVCAIGKVPIRLPGNLVTQDLITLSGFSSGGTMAQQVYFSYSSLISGIAVFSHAFYRCGPNIGSAKQYDDVCTIMGDPRTDDVYDPNLALLDIQNYTKLGLIDDPKNMANKPLYVFAGTSSYTFSTDASLRIVNVFEPFINNLDMIHTRVQNANWTLPSDRPGLPGCSDPPNKVFISNCGFSGPLDALQHLLGKDVIRAPRRNLKLQPLLEFDQTEFFFGVKGSIKTDMDTTGYLYIPTACKNINAEAECRLHIYFHGCLVGREYVGNKHILQSGYMELAEANGIVMLFPQTLKSKTNTFGCWDTFGATGNLYATQLGAQVSTIKNMLDRLLSDFNDSMEEVEEEQQESTFFSSAASYPASSHVSKKKYSKNRENCIVARVSENTILQTCS